MKKIPSTLLATAALALAPCSHADEAPERPLVFSEDFEKGLSKGLSSWQLSDPQGWVHRDLDGNHVLGIKARKNNYEPAVRSPYHIALLKGMEFADFALTFRVRSTKDTGDHRDCCVFFNHQDPTHFYYVHLGARPDPHSGQIMIVNGADRKALTDNQNLVPWDNDWHNVKVVRNSTDGSIKIYFDDMEKPIMSVVDKTFGKGRVGIGSFDDMNDFDDFQLWGE